MAEVKYEIQKQLGEISSSVKGWAKEVNLVSWNGAKAKIDIRDWAPEHKKMGKGITLTEDETKKLYCILKELCSEI